MPSPRVAVSLLLVLILHAPMIALPSSLPAGGTAVGSAEATVSTVAGLEAAWSEQIKRARQAGDGERARAVLDDLMPHAEAPGDVPFPAMGFVDDASGKQPLWAGDILVADQITDVEGHLNMTGDAAGRFFVVVESMNVDCINIYRSDDGGVTWQHYFFICGTGGNDITSPAITAPEFARDYLYIAYAYFGAVQVLRINLSTNTAQIFAVAYYDHYGQPRIVTDNHDYNDYYVYVIVDAKVYVSTDQGQTWSTSGNLHPEAQTVATPDVAVANDILYATWFYVLAGDSGSGAGLVPWGIALRTSSDYGVSWSNIRGICEDCYAPRIAAVQRQDDAMIVYEVDNGGQHDDVKYAYTANGGVNWTADYCLSCQPAIDDRAPSIATDETGYHATYFNAGDITYRWTPSTNVHLWPVNHRINDTNQASGDYAPATVAIDWQRNAPGVAWSDERTPTLATYFDRLGNHVYYVRPDGTGDLPTIDDAASVAADGDTIRLHDGVYFGPGNHDIDYRGKELVIESVSGDPTTCIIDCGMSGPSRGFTFVTGETRGAQLRGVTIRGGQRASGGAVRISGADPTIRDCIFEDNHATDSGGAIVCNDAFPLVAECQFIGNTADNAGGAIVTGLPGAGGEYVDCLFQDNWALWGGGAIYLYGGSPDITRCTFWRNSSDHWGGALHTNLEESDPQVFASTFCANSAPQGGGIYTRNGADPIVENSIIAFSEEGQAVYCESSGTATLSCSDIFGNAGGNWVGCIAGQSGVSGNMSLDPLFCNRENGDLSLRQGSPCLPGNNSCSVLIGAHGQGCAPSAGPDLASELSFRVLESTPNPFRSSTTIQFVLPERAAVQIDLFDVSGRHIRSLAQGAVYPAGAHAVSWDGRHEDGSLAAAGVYYYRVRMSDRELSRKLLLLR